MLPIALVFTSSHRCTRQIEDYHVEKGWVDVGDEEIIWKDPHPDSAYRLCLFINEK